MITIYQYLFSWIPDTNVRLFIAGLLTLTVIFIVLRIVKIVLDSLPFL